LDSLALSGNTETCAHRATLPAALRFLSESVSIQPSVSGVMLNPPRVYHLERNVLLRPEIQEIRDAMEAFKAAIEPEKQAAKHGGMRARRLLKTTQAEAGITSRGLTGVPRLKPSCEIRSQRDAPIW
jgi:predicted transcriptional regulator